MQLSISREILLKHLRYMSAVVEKRTSIAILSNVRLRATGSTLEMTATDNDITVQGTTEAFIEAEGTTTVSAHKFFEIASKIPEGVMVNMQLADGGNRLSITAGKARFSLACLPADAFPDMTEVTDGTSFTIASKALSSGLAKTLFAASTDDTRAYLNGVYLHTAQAGDATVLRYVATDGHRLAKVDQPLPEGVTELEGVILPRKCVNELRKIAEEAGDVSVVISDTRIQAKAGDITLTSKVIDGTFPDYNRVIPKENKSKMSVARRTLLQAVDRVAILSHEKSRSIRFSLSPETLTISANNPDQENATEDVKVDYIADALDVGFNAKYISDIGSLVESDDMEFLFKDATSPVLVTDGADSTSLFVVMPMRI